jgi:hypothetical protein
VATRSGSRSSVTTAASAVGSEVIAYVPTQVVAEFFRTVYAEEGAPLNGVIYRSAPHARGVCCALFVERERCLDRGATLDGEPALVLEDFEVWDGLT